MWHNRRVMRFYFPRILVALLFFSVLSVGFVAAENLGRSIVVLRAEQEIKGQLHQQALVLKNNQVEFSKNSGFLCPHATKVRLGKFVGAMNPTQKQEFQVLSAVEKKLGRTPGPAVQGQHPIRYFLNEKEIYLPSSPAKMVRQALLEYCDESLLKGYAYLGEK